jgi:hypothetical protein
VAGRPTGEVPGVEVPCVLAADLDQPALAVLKILRQLPHLTVESAQRLPTSHEYHPRSSSGVRRQACPGCGDTTGVQPVPGISPRVRAWSCSACRTDWAITVVNPRPFLEQLTAAVDLAAARSMVREIITLADQAPMLTDEQLRFRLRALAECGRHPDQPLPPVPNRPLVEP